MEAKTLEMIQGMVLASSGIETLARRDRPAVLVPAGYQVEPLERLDDAPWRTRRIYRTTSLGAFLAYFCAASRSGSGSAVYVDPKRMQVEAIIDHDDGWGDHRAYLNLEPTAAYGALVTNDTRDMDQRQFLDFLIDWHPQITFTGDGDESIDPGHAHHAIRHINVAAKADSGHREGDMGRAVSAFAEIEVRAAGDHKLPALLHFRCHPYQGLEERSFVGRIRARISDKGPYLSYRIEAKESEYEVMGQELADQVQAGVAPRTAVHIGTVEHQGG